VQWQWHQSGVPRRQATDSLQILACLCRPGCVRKRTPVARMGDACAAEGKLSPQTLRSGRLYPVSSMIRKKQNLSRKLAQAGLIIILLPVVPLALFSLTLFWLHRAFLYLLVWCIWLPRGKDALVVYSDSPIWRDYMMQEIIPLLENRAVVLNWSERRKWPKWSFAVHVFRSFGGRREFNPLVVLFRPFSNALVLRFWPAFKDWQHGQTTAVDSLRLELKLHL